MATDDKNVPEPQGAEAERSGRAATFIPPVDIYETEHEAVLVVDLPGCDEGAVDVRLEEGVLTIAGRVEPDDFPGHQLTYSEYRVGDFERSFTVSDLVNTAEVQAAVKDGVLRLTLPKVEAAKPRKIEVKVT